MKGNKITGIIMIFLSLVIAFVAGKEFLKTRELEPIVKGDGVTSMQKLSDYLPDLKGTRGDSDIYILQGKEPGGSVLILGGTHPNEPAAFLTTVLLVENLKVDKGTVYIIPRANGSAMSHNDPQEASPQRFTIKTPYGERWFRFGSRATNPLDQQETLTELIQEELMAHIQKKLLML